MKTKFLLLVSLFFVSLGFSQKKWTLKECVDHALENNITIQQNLLNVELAELNVKSTKGNFLPNLNGSTGGNLSFGSSFDPVSQNRVSNTLFGGSIGVSSGVTIFNGYQNLNTYKQAQLGVERSKLTLDKIQNDISLFVVNGYLNVLFAKENLNVARVQAEISKKQVEAAKDRFEAGVIPKGDLLNVESTAANDQQNLVTRENTLTIALLNLSQLLQVPSEGFDVADINVGAPAGILLYDSADVVFQKALTNQPQIKNAELGIKNADYNIEIAKGRFLPSLSASLSLSTNYGFDLDLPAGFRNTKLLTQLDNNLGYGVGFNLSIPIFNRNQTKINVDRQFVNKEISKVSLDNEKLQLQQTIEQAFVDAKAAVKAYEAAKISLDSQKEAFKNAQESYNLGAMTLFDFDLVRNRLVSAESTLIRSKFDFVFKTKVLQFYYGELNLD
ncbi:TolC family protein [Pseudotenacibaculum sp. MALMAid0570]|uniref:TolC family protein n=1 Tax=Pseudotenacibaculum sp. MALMAid0570 TaxID=3143938 RepID=UPI0032DE3843